MSTTVSSPLSAIRFLGTAIAQIIGLVAIIVLMALASVHARFNEKNSQGEARPFDALFALILTVLGAGLFSTLP